MKIFEHTGQTPVRVDTPEKEAILEIIKLQLVLLERVTQEKWLIEAGSKISSRDTK